MTDHHLSFCRGMPQCGQAATEALLLTAALVVGFWGLNWMQGDSGVVAMLVDALHIWHQRFANTLALPIS